MDIEPTTEYEDMNIPVNNHHKQTAKSSLPDGWTEVAGVFDEGQHLYVKTVVSQQLPFIWHPRKCKFDFSSKHSEFYSNNNKCIGPTIVCHLWENQNNLQAVLEEFDQMIPCQLSKDNCIRNVEQVKQTISLKESVSPATVIPVEVVDIGSVQLVTKTYARKPIRM